MFLTFIICVIQFEIISLTRFLHVSSNH